MLADELIGASFSGWLSLQPGLRQQVPDGADQFTVTRHVYWIAV